MEVLEKVESLKYSTPLNNVEVSDDNTPRS